MVSGRMGLLDEAIREHLELKRRAGADPGEIAHAERAALAPVFPDEPRDGEVEAPAPSAGGEPAAEPDAPADPADALGDETVEIDMQAVLDGAVDDDVAIAAPHAVAAGEDAFEWDDDVARGHDADAEGPPEQIPGQERMSLE
jgi:hypothetical protein